MEIQTITPRIDNSAPSSHAQPEQNLSLTEEAKDDSSPSITPFTTDEWHLSLSGNALKLSESMRSRESQPIDAAATITESEQAIRIARQTADLIKQFPPDGLAAQSNLISNVVKGLLG